MKLHREITVAQDIPAVFDTDGLEISPFFPRGTFTLENNASLIQTKDVIENENEGNIIMERIADDLSPIDYVYWSSPVDSFNMASIQGSNKLRWDTQILNNGTPQTTGNWVSASNDLMIPGKGYIVRTTNGNNDYTTNFLGTPNNGDISIEIEKSVAPLPLDVENRHFNLVGNPYPSAINADTFLQENANIEGYVQIWTHASGLVSGTSVFYDGSTSNYSPNDYVQYNLTGANPDATVFDGKIAAGQGFIVKVLDLNSINNNGEFINFNNGMRYDASENAYDNSQFYRANDKNKTIGSSQEKQLIWLSLTNDNNITTTAAIGYVEGATLEEDRLYDAKAISGGFEISSLVGDSKMGIQGRPLPFTDTDIVPLGINVAKNGIYKIGIDNLKGSVFVEDNQKIYIEDTYLNIIHDLRVSPYGFTLTAGAVNDRFLLRYTSETLSLPEVSASETFAFIANGNLKVKSSQQLESIQIYDLAGKQVANYKLNGAHRDFSSEFSFARSVYLAVIKLDNGTLIKQKLLN